jgi:hypothetical protein
MCSLVLSLLSTWIILTHFSSDTYQSINQSIKQSSKQASKQWASSFGCWVWFLMTRFSANIPDPIRYLILLLWQSNHVSTLPSQSNIRYFYLPELLFVTKGRYNLVICISGILLTWRSKNIYDVFGWLSAAYRPAVKRFHKYSGREHNR